VSARWARPHEATSSRPVPGKICLATLVTEFSGLVACPASRRSYPFEAEACGVIGVVAVRTEVTTRSRCQARFPRSRVARADHEVREPVAVSNKSPGGSGRPARIGRWATGARDRELSRARSPDVPPVEARRLAEDDVRAPASAAGEGSRKGAVTSVFREPHRRRSRPRPAPATVPKRRRPPWPSQRPSLGASTRVQPSPPASGAARHAPRAGGGAGAGRRGPTRVLAHSGGHERVHLVNRQAGEARFNKITAN